MVKKQPLRNTEFHYWRLNPLMNFLSRKFLAFALLSVFICPPAYPADRAAIRSAEDSYNSGDIARAQSLVYEALQKYPYSYLKPEFLLMLSATYLKSGEPDQAEIILRGLKTMFPRYEQNTGAQILQASIYQTKNDLERAQRTLLDSKTAEGLYHSAFLLEGTGQSFASISRLRELEEKFPESALRVPARLALANSYFSLNEFDAAKKSLEEMGEGLSPNVGVLRSYLAGGVALREENRLEAGRIFSGLADDDLRLWGEVLQGIYALKANDLAEAENLFKKGLFSSDPVRLARSALGLGEVYLKSNAPEKAVSLCNSVLGNLTGDGDRERLLLLRGAANQRLGRMSEAAQDFEAVSAKAASPWRTKALLLLAQTLWLNNEFTRLARDIPPVISEIGKKSRSPDLLLSAMLAADANYTLKRYKDAEAIYGDILNETPPAKLSAQTVSGLVACLVLQKKYSEAEKILDELMVRFGEDRDVVRFGLLSQAHLFWNEQKFGEASARYERYVQMFPEDEKAPLAFFQWGGSLEKSNDSAKALEIWADLRKKFPDSAFAFKSLARSASLAEKTGQNELARELYEKLANSGNSPTAELALLQLGMNLLATNDPIGAIRALNEFAARFPKSSRLGQAKDALKEAFLLVSLTDPKKLDEIAMELTGCEFGGEAMYYQGIDLLEKGEYKKAASIFKKIWTDYPSAPSASQALFYEGEADFRAGDFGPAVGVLRQFARQFPTHDLAPLARSRRATALINLGFNDEALAALKEIGETSPQTEYAAAALLNTARVYEKQNDLANETKTYETFLHDFPQNPRANFVFWRLGQLMKRQGLYEVSLKYYRQVRAAKDVATADDLTRVISDLERVINQGGKAQ